MDSIEFNVFLLLREREMFWGFFLVEVLCICLNQFSFVFVCLV